MSMLIQNIFNKNFGKILSIFTFPLRNTSKPLGIRYSSKNNGVLPKSSLTALRDNFNIVDKFGRKVPVDEFRARGKYNMRHVLVEYPQRPKNLKPADKDWTATLGKKKRARAYVRFRKGKGTIKVNGKPFYRYFEDIDVKARIIEPLLKAGMFRDYEIVCKVEGGGFSGQGSAVAVGIAKAIKKRDPEKWREILEKSDSFKNYARPGFIIK